MRTEAFPIREGGERRSRRASRPRVGRFEDSAYGPLQLRPTLRARLVAGERLVGFGVGKRAVRPSEAMRSVAAGVVPGVGQAVLILQGARQQTGRRLYVLTDRRLLVMRADRRGRRPDKAVEIDAPLEALRVRGIGKRGAFRSEGYLEPRGRTLRLARREPPVKFQIEADGASMRWVEFGKGRSRRAARRLREGLWALAE